MGGNLPDIWPTGEMWQLKQKYLFTINNGPPN